MHTGGWALNSVHYQLKPANGWDRFGQTQAPSPMTNRMRASTTEKRPSTLLLLRTMAKHGGAMRPRLFHENGH